MSTLHLTNWLVKKRTIIYITSIRVSNLFFFFYTSLFPVWLFWKETLYSRLKTVPQAVTKWPRPSNTPPPGGSDKNNTLKRGIVFASPRSRRSESPYNTPDLLCGATPAPGWGALIMKRNALASAKADAPEASLKLHGLASLCQSARCPFDSDHAPRVPVDNGS